MTFDGLVIQKRWGVGTKSEHDAVFLKTPRGEHRMIQRGANPFDNPALRKLVGKTITVTGFLRSQDDTLVIDSWVAP